MWRRVASLMAGLFCYLQESGFRVERLGLGGYRDPDARDNYCATARHQDITTLADLEKVKITDRRMWIRVSSQQSNKRKLSDESVRVLGIFEHWLLHMCPFRSMRSPPTLCFDARADASAKGTSCCIGGYVKHPSLGHRWFRESFKQSEPLSPKPWTQNFRPSTKPEKPKP